MAEANAVTPPLQTAAATLEKAKLRKVLSRIDLVLFTACAILGFDTVAASAEAGAQAITWLLISLVIFLIPYGMLTAELGSAFPPRAGLTSGPGWRSAAARACLPRQSSASQPSPR